ncbi:preprotein translocase subunit SecA [Mariniblastus fucicola]|uniref:Protein translocase subunit SecA n=1 Tax=Mariniblastus fucicola TaxID=980251 RepID=A0A5B9P2R2_9BACT|nr:DEAD/DEAH box helicase [Mariniblastus fucicola]QEG20817.1 preprotein translocase subunit SecA [Mariniblastus fucicola]
MNRALEFSLVQKIRRKAKPLADVSAEKLREAGLSLKYRASIGTAIDKLIPEAFPLVIEAIRRSLDMVPYDMQIFAAMQIAKGRVAEMKTGEGKTLTATMPAYLHALSGRGSHVVTVNDYLASRDHKLLEPVFRTLGLSSGVVTSDTEPTERKRAYRKDVTYGTAKEFGFDFLRDRLSLSSGQTRSQLLHRELNYVLVDEVDSILIDEARTPLIIGITDPEEQKLTELCFRWAAENAPQFIEERDFHYQHDKKKVELKPGGIQRLRGLPQNEGTRRVPIRKLYEYIENAIKVRRDFQLDQHYTIREGKVAIIDEFTGRIAEGRQWQRGIHQSVEAKEKLEVTPNVGSGATVTMQTFFRLYESFGGMSGTVETSSREFKKVYKKKTVVVPTHRPVIRKKLASKIFADLDSKFEAIVAETVEMTNASRAVLIGTRSVETSELLSRLLSDRGIDHEVLNANQLEREAEIIKASGEAGKVTVATNMAGRGTDFILAPKVKQAGGLHVILSEVHESQRIDWQLVGRGSRQGQPGSFRIFVSMDDDVLLQGLGPGRTGRLRRKYSSLPKKGSVNPKVFRHFQLAQRRLERKHLVDRMILLKQDKERQERHIEMGQDPYCDVVNS